MCVLTGKEIKRRAKEIFSNDSGHNDSFQEASYDLRVAIDTYIRVGGIMYSPDRNPYREPVIVINPGELAMLPTVESFNMPKDLVGSLKIKFSHSRKGLTPLFGPKVDPYFGSGHDDERLFLWVSNLGTEPVVIRREERVFNIQFHTLTGDSPDFVRKDPIGPQIESEAINFGSEPDLGFMNEMRERVTNDLNDRLSRVEHGTSQVVLFGIFLIASALLAGALTVLFSLTPQLDSEQNALVNSLLNSRITLWVVWGIIMSLAIYMVALAVSVVVFMWKTLSR